MDQDYQAVPGDAQPACDEQSPLVWVRRLTDGDLAVAMPNLSGEDAELSVCLDALKWPHGETAKARSVWAQKDLGTFTHKFSAQVASHDTLLLRLSPA